jgi:hypothetical protein
VKALEEELLARIKQHGLNVKPQILVVSIINDSTAKSNFPIAAV